MEVDYYSVACEELRFLEYGISSNLYNSIVVVAQQVAEKMLKSVIEKMCLDTEDLMKTFRLRKLCGAIQEVEPSFILDCERLTTLEDYYLDVRYPGENYVIVTEDECLEAVKTMYSIVAAVNMWRREHGYSVYEFVSKI